MIAGLNETASAVWTRVDGESLPPMLVLNIARVGAVMVQRREDEPDTATIIDVLPFQQRGQDPEMAKRKLMRQAIEACGLDSKFKTLEVVANSPDEASMFIDYDTGELHFEYTDQEDPRLPRKIPELTLNDLITDFDGVLARLPTDMYDHPQVSVVICAQVGQP